MEFDRNRHRRFLQDHLARLLVLGLLVLWLGACASLPEVAPDKGTDQGTAVIPFEKTGLFRKPQADAMMFNEGMSWLGLPDKPADYAKAKETFAVLTKNYPQSKWRPLAETFIHLIDSIQSFQAKSLSDQGLADRLKQDNERLKKDIQALGSKFQTDRDSLLKENEKLRKDMELLKQLEVQLDKREKMLR